MNHQTNDTPAENKAMDAAKPRVAVVDGVESVVLPIGGTRCQIHWKSPHLGEIKDLDGNSVSTFTSDTPMGLSAACPAPASSGRESPLSLLLKITILLPLLTVFYIVYHHERVVDHAAQNAVRAQAAYEFAATHSELVGAGEVQKLRRMADGANAYAVQTLAKYIADNRIPADMIAQ